MTSRRQSLRVLIFMGYLGVVAAAFMAYANAEPMKPILTITSFWLVVLALGIALARDPICRCMRLGWYRAHRRIYFRAWRIVRTLRRRLGIAVLGSALGVVGVYVVASLTFPRKYEAFSAILAPTPPKIDFYQYPGALPQSQPDLKE